MSRSLGNAVLWALLTVIGVMSAGCSSPAGLAGATPEAREPMAVWAHESIAWDRTLSTGGPEFSGELFRGEIVPEHAFSEAVMSFNAAVAESAGIAAQIRVQRGGAWTPWATLATWGAIIPAAHTKIGFPGGRVAIDELLLEGSAERAEVRVLARGSVTLNRLDVVLTRRLGEGPIPEPSPGEALTLAVPFRPNQAEDPAMRSRLCSPTSLGMLLAWNGVEPAHAEICTRVHDDGFDLFGIWPRNIQASRTFGVGARLARFAGWDEVRAHLAEHGPIAISITAEEGELRGAGYDLTAGHLIVLTGLDERGDALVLDPAYGELRLAERLYLAEDLTRVWLQRKRGTAYALTGERYAPMP